MQTQLADFLRDTPDGEEAQRILGNCVHCGFCTATCPTYQLLGDELDGPRGRIYLIKQMVEGAEVTRSTQLHLDRCLTCRSCETTCPSGVEYGKLAEIGRKYVEQRVTRPLGERLARTALARFVPERALFEPAMKLGQAMRPLLPAALRAKVPPRPDDAARALAREWPAPRHARRVVLLEGCVQPSMLPSVNPATARVLDAIGISTVTAPRAGCCGAVRLHLGHEDAALDDARRNVDAWWPLIKGGGEGGSSGTGGTSVEAIVINASGCGATVREYGHLLRNDPAYAERAARVSALTRDVSEVIGDHRDALRRQCATLPATEVAYHPPCTLQHGQKIRGNAEETLRSLGLNVKLPGNSHLCCGSAGTYSILQPELAGALRERKLDALQALTPDVIASANIGCITHLQAGTTTPVVHWIELVDARLRAAASEVTA